MTFKTALKNAYIGILLLVAIYCDITTSWTIENNTCMMNYERGDRNNICTKAYTINYIEMSPYDNFSFENEIREKCCGKYVKVTKRKTRYLHDVKLSANGPDFIFPVLERKDTVRIRGYYFLPFVRCPILIYMTPMGNTLFEHAVKSCLNLYPLMTICLLMSLVVGFLVWAVESRSQYEEFPKSFLSGWFKGIWWSVITLASTGLERTPKSFVARIIAVLWIVVGVIMLGILTSLITTAMIQTPSTPTDRMEGRNVGSLKYRDYDAHIIEKHGGNVVNVSANNISEEILKLIGYLGDSKIDGFLVDKYTLLAHAARNKKHFKKTKMYDDQVMSYGILVRELEVYNYFRYMMDENWLSYERRLSSYVKSIEQEEEEEHGRMLVEYSAPLFSPSDHNVYYAMVGFGSILFLICVFGMLYEMQRRRWCTRKAYCVEDVRATQRTVVPREIELTHT